MTYITNRAGHFGQWLVGIDNTHLFPFSAICHLKIIRDDDSGGSYHQGTGFYIGNDRILTCGHNIEEDGHRALRIEITPGKNGTTTAGPTFTVQPSSCFIHPRYRDANVAGGYNEDFDMAVIRVSTPPPYGIIFDELDDSLTSQSAIAVCGYGYVASQFDDRLHLDIDTIRTVNDTLNQASYDAFTAGGNSGSPVFFVRSVDDPVEQVCRQSAVVVGVHILGYPATAGRPETSLNSCCLITPDKRRWILQDWSAYGGRPTTRTSPPGRALAGRRLAATNVYAGGRAAPVIAHGAHERYGKRSVPRAHGQTANESFDDVDLLDANLADRRRSDTRVVSSLTDAEALISIFSTGRWSPLG
jgi:V8-like Glu-specific endopeptidase